MHETRIACHVGENLLLWLWHSHDKILNGSGFGHDNLGTYIIWTIWWKRFDLKLILFSTAVLQQLPSHLPQQINLNFTWFCETDFRFSLNKRERESREAVHCKIYFKRFDRAIIVILFYMIWLHNITFHLHVEQFAETDEPGILEIRSHF